uniref:MI domain-containing protein n=1 Tax=Neobodo designis TaxID=312471 RepID=A0A7S1M1I0_NEODS|mmetsp:Transcript_32311/g.99997  ORF Transcript_32311/g.99997 Transcript_32311/m.99997 type:complete len:542 (+) Transcript_32311:30-1655(+)
MARAGVYVPPFRRAQLDAAEASAPDPVNQQSSFQREYWDALKKTFMGTVNRATRTNVRAVAIEVLRENVVKGRGLFCRAAMRAQNHSPELTPVLAALVSYVNWKLPVVGELLVRRLVFQFKRCYKRQDVLGMSNAARFLTHLVNQRVQHELLVLKILATLLCNGTPTADDVQVAAAVFREGFKFLEQENPAAFHFLLEPIRDLVGGGALDLKSECTLEGLLAAVRKWQEEREKQDVVPADLDIVPFGEQVTHAVDLDEETDPENKLDLFVFDPEFDKHDEDYEALKVDLIGAEAEAPEAPAIPTTDDDLQNENVTEDTDDSVVDASEVSAQRKAIFLIFKSSIRAEEMAHKLLKQVTPGRESIVVTMIFDAATRERTYNAVYGALSDMLCRAGSRFQHHFERYFGEFFEHVDDSDSKTIDVTARLYACLLRSGSVHWRVLGCVRLDEASTTPSSRKFIRVLFQELGESMTVSSLREALSDAETRPFVSGLFPTDNDEAMEFAINFFEVISRTGVDLRPLTANLRRLHGERASRMGKRERED